MPSPSYRNCHDLKEDSQGLSPIIYVLGAGGLARSASKTLGGPPAGGQKNTRPPLSEAKHLTRPLSH